MSPGIDDSLAIMMALTSKEVEVLGITIVCGNAPVQMGFENIKKVLKHMNRLDVPVYLGADKPLKKDMLVLWIPMGKMDWEKAF